MDQFGEKSSSTSTSGGVSCSVLMMMNNNSNNTTNNNNNNNNMPLPLATASGDQRVTGAALNMLQGSGTNGNYFKNFYNEESSNTTSSAPSSAMMRTKIMAHPLFPRLLTAYANCQKVII